MSFQSLNPELTAKVLFLANLQRNLVGPSASNSTTPMQVIQMQNQNQNAAHHRPAEGNAMSSTSAEQLMHPLLMPSLVRRMLEAALDERSKGTALSTQSASSLVQYLFIRMSLPRKSRRCYLPLTPPISSPTPVNAPSIPATLPSSPRSNGSSFGWGNRERKMEENWRMQNRNA